MSNTLKNTFRVTIEVIGRIMMGLAPPIECIIKKTESKFDLQTQ